MAWSQIRGQLFEKYGAGEEGSKELVNTYKKETPGQSVEEAKFTDKQIKMAYGVANDKRYKGGNYSGAVKAIEKIAKGLSKHPSVQKVLRVTNEGRELTEKLTVPMGVEAWIRDFLKSDAPQFKGKSKDEVIKMAVAAFQKAEDEMKKEVKEAVDPEDQGEYDREGEMAKTQLRAIVADASHMIEMFADDQNLPEWVQNKITKASDYLNSAHRYMMNKGDNNQ